MILKQNTSPYIILPNDSNDVLLKSYMDVMRPIIASRTSICAFLVFFFSLSHYLQISISSAKVVAQNCQTYIQNLIDYVLKVNNIARNINTCIGACKHRIMYVSTGEDVLV